MWDKLRLEWETGLQRLPFFTQRVAVALLGLLVVSLALVGGVVVLWGGPQGSELELRPPPEAHDPLGPASPGAPAPSAPEQAGGAQAPVGAQSPTSSPGDAGAGPRSALAPAAGGGQRSPSSEPTGTPTTTTTTSGTPPSTTGGGLGPLPLPPVLSTLLK